MVFDINEHAHRRRNPLTDSWILVSPQRSMRGRQAQKESLVEEVLPKHDPNCPLCAGNERESGLINPPYTSAFAFWNDFPAMISENVEETDFFQSELFTVKAERGLCRVICFSPRHDLTIPEMAVEDIRKIVDVWCSEYGALSGIAFVNHVLIFENKGTMMGCSHAHPHGQIWAQGSIPEEAAKKNKTQLAYYKKHGKTLLSDYWAAELTKKERMIFQNDHFVGLVPYWATWPFEAMIIPKRAMPRITNMTNDEKNSFADAYKQLTVCYDNLFECSFPYSAGIHQAPTDGKEHPEWHFHKTFYPPLLRSAQVKKVMSGYELFANPHRDITPERAAALMRRVSKYHYKADF
jgi:UDPglucose--hexose-1-phosphate uridylyltransferase